jgi:hypothetical protein
VGEPDGDEVGENGGGLEVGDEEGKDDVYEWDGVGGGSDDDNNGEGDAIVVVYGRVRKRRCRCRCRRCRRKRRCRFWGIRRERSPSSQKIYMIMSIPQKSHQSKEKNIWVMIPPN